MKSFHARTPRRPPATAEGGAARQAPQAETGEERERASGLTRADVLLVAQGLAPSRAAAQKLIAAGRVARRSGAVSVAIAKAAERLPAQTELVLAGEPENHFTTEDAEGAEVRRS